MSAKEAGKGSKPPKYLEDADRHALGRATDIADRQYQAYGGERIAGLGQNERQANSMALDASANNQARGYMNKAGATIDGVTEWNSEQADKYMNPYIDKVVNRSLDNENRAFQQRDYQNQSRSAAAGAYGGDRNALSRAALEGQHLREVGEISDRGYAGAFDNAMKGWSADNQTKLAASQAYDRVGGDINKLNSNQITDLMRTGQSDRLLRQMDMDVDYSDFIEKRDWDVTNLQPLLQAIGASKAGTVSTGGGANKTAAALGAAGALVGAFGQAYSGSKSYTTGYAPGESVTLDNGSTMNVTRPTID